MARVVREHGVMESKVDFLGSVRGCAGVAAVRVCCGCDGVVSAVRSGFARVTGRVVGVAAVASVLWSRWRALRGCV